MSNSESWMEVKVRSSDHDRFGRSVVISEFHGFYPTSQNDTQYPQLDTRITQVDNVQVTTGSPGASIVSLRVLETGHVLLVHIGACFRSRAFVMRSRQRQA